MSLLKGDYYSLRDIYNYLSSNFDHLSSSQIKELLSYLFGLNYSDLFLYMDDIFLIDDKVKEVFLKVKRKYPVNYITQNRNFYGLDFYINEDVLIPRYETEVLVEEAIKRVKKGVILDLCTGSGCIPISVMKNSGIDFGIGVDISFNALKVAKANKKRLLSDKKLEFVCFDVLEIDEIFKDKIEFDLITCNPPYVDINGEYEDSIMYEPSEALFADDNGLKFYKKLLYKLPKLCKKNGFIIFEIPWDKLDMVKNIFCGKEIELVKDLSGKERVLIWKNL